MQSNMPTLERARWFIVLATLFLLCDLAFAGEKLAKEAEGVVVAVSLPARDVGREILRRGGTAVDAAVATAFALAVTWPSAGNIGGGGFMMIHPGPGKRPVCVEYRETAPAAAAVSMLEDSRPVDGHTVCGTPGTVAGLALAHKHYGKLPWRDVVLPAVQLAREGFCIDAALARSLNAVLKESRDFAELQRVFAPPSGGHWQAGDRLVQPDLARTLETIAAGGPETFYRGPIADQLAAEMKAGGGLITKDDLAAYRARFREPIHGTYRGYEVFAPPPPSSGGVCLIEMLNILECLPLKGSFIRPGRAPPASPWPPQVMHYVVEAMRRAFCDRARYLGDPDFVCIPSHLTSKEYAKKLAAEIDPTKATRSDRLAPEIPLAEESNDTTHFSVVDRQGMAVANTYTLENAYGCRVVVRGAGFLLNNEMTDFNRVPGRTDRKGEIGTLANLIAPRKRMLSSQTPTLVCRDGQLVFVTGSPGGRTIINTVLCVVLGVVEFGMDGRQAIDAPRLHHQWLPDRVGFEGLDRPEYAAVVEQLKRMGHTFEPKARKQGDAHCIWIAPGTRHPIGVADQRVNEHAAR